MLTRRIREAAAAVAVFAAAACGSSSEPSGPSGPTTLDIVSGNGQVQLVGSALTTPLTVRVSAGGSPVKGATVTFAISSGTATLNPASAVTDATGQARTQVTLGSSAGTVAVTATVNGTNASTTFFVAAGTGTITTACQAGGATALGVGEVRASLGATGICLGGVSTQAEYALVAFHQNTDSSAASPIGVTAKGAVGLSTPSATPAFSESALERIPSHRSNATQTAFEQRLHAAAQRELEPKIPSAQAWYRQRPLYSLVPANPAIGSLVTLNANGEDNCTNPINVIARVAAVSSTAIVLADTANPTGGFTNAEYASFATTFDTLIRPLDVANFGEPSDIDKNGKILIFFTKEVNKLTPRGSGGVVGGFFYERDLFPKEGTRDLSGCASSNVAEMYYALVPDPTARFSDVRSKQSVLELTPGTLAHEFQHLINAGRRLYVNNAPDFETVWLNEGISHIAEELLYYRVAKLAPRQNVGTTIIRANPPASIDNFNNYQGDNIGRYEIFLGRTAQVSAWAGNDDLETRGATWNMLRYLADHRGSADADTWLLLDNSKLSGHQNLASVFGPTYMTQVRDWATSILSDDVPGVTDVRFLEPSWNMRSIFPNLVDAAGRPLNQFPLRVIPVGDGLPGATSIQGGAEAYFRFSVPANGTASIDWSVGTLPVSPLIQLTIVRTK